MNNFNKVCPSGNVMVDSVVNQYDPDTYFIQDRARLRQYIRVSSFSVSEIREIIKSFNNNGYYEVEK